MEVTPAAAAGSFEYRGQTYYFCARAAWRSFRPIRLDTSPPNPGRSGSHAKDIEYTCPMHPEVVQMGPGTCPICGMALEPKEIRAGELKIPNWRTCRGDFGSASF